MEEARGLLLPLPRTVDGNSPLHTGNDGADLSRAQAYAETPKLEQCRRLETTRALAKTASSGPARSCYPPGELAKPNQCRLGILRMVRLLDFAQGRLPNPA